MPDDLHNPRARNRSFPQRARRSAGVLALACSLWSCAEAQRVVGDPSDGLVFIRVVDGSNDVAPLPYNEAELVAGLPTSPLPPTPPTTGFRW